MEEVWIIVERWVYGGGGTGVWSGFFDTAQDAMDYVKEHSVDHSDKPWTPRRDKEYNCEGDDSSICVQRLTRA